MIEIDMQAPKTCGDCPFMDDNGDYPYCIVLQQSQGYTFNIYAKRFPNCPIKTTEEKYDSDDLPSISDRGYISNRKDMKELINKLEIDLKQEKQNYSKNGAEKWEDFKENVLTDEWNKERTNIECPECGKKIWRRTDIVLTTYPPEYRYECECGWSGVSHG